MAGQKDAAIMIDNARTRTPTRLRRNHTFQAIGRFRMVLSADLSLL